MMNQKQFDYLLEYIQNLDKTIQSLDNYISNILERIETLER